MGYILKFNPVISILLIAVCIFFIFGTSCLFAEEDVETPKEEKSGVVGGVFNFIGDVLAFPFRLVGQFFDAIF